MVDTFRFFSLIECWLAMAAGLSVLVAGRYALALLRGKQRAPRWIEAALWLSAMAAVSVLTIDLHRWAKGRVDDFAPLSTIGFLLAAMLITFLHLQVAALRLSAAQLRRCPVLWGALAAAVAVGLWSSYRLHASLQPSAWDPPVLAARPIRMVLEPRFVGVSDRGREIPLYRSATESLSPELAWYLESHPDHPKRHMSVIARAVPDASTNCHGWVFANGNFMLDVEGIRTVLEDNGYHPCTAPRPGDLIVYLEGNGVPVHTGVVSGILHDGTVMIESKWGVDGRYLHRPEDQPYAQDFVYYRSERGGHEIAIGETAPALAKQRLRVPRRARKA